MDLKLIFLTLVTRTNATFDSKGELTAQWPIPKSLTVDLIILWYLNFFMLKYGKIIYDINSL